MPGTDPSQLRPGAVAQQIVEAHRRITAAHRVYITQQAQAIAMVKRIAERAARGGARTASESGPQSQVALDAIPPEAAQRAMTREQLETHASGRISDVFGPAFAGQDDYPRQVRMPEPPLLLADRVLARPVVILVALGLAGLSAWFAMAKPF